jgi:hypothetical protein
MALVEAADSQGRLTVNRLEFRLMTRNARVGLFDSSRPWAFDVDD